MPNILKTEAEEIASKLKSDIPRKPKREKFTIDTKEGKNHTIIILWYDGVRVGQFGIQRGKKSQGHNYIPG